MKFIIAFLFALLLLLPGTVFAWSLICDPQVGVVSYDVEVDGVIIAALFPAETNGSIRYNIDHLGPGPVSFRLRAISASGWGSDWMVPFVAGKPNITGNARVAKDVGD